MSLLLLLGGVTAPPRESHILDGLDLADGAVFEIVDAPIWVPAVVRDDMIGGPDSDGLIPRGDGRADNATLTLTLRVREQATADLALHMLGRVVAKLEAIRRSRSGLVHHWTPRDASDTWEWVVRRGTITDLPMDSHGDKIGWLHRAPRFTIVLEGDPFLKRVGEVVTYGPVSSSAPVLSLSLANVPGHVDAEATVTVTDGASRARRHLEGGLGDDSDAPLLIDADDLDVTVGVFAAALATRSGSHSAQVARALLAPRVQAVVGTGALGHVGVHRVKARVWAASVDVRMRLAYRTADGAYSYTPWVAAVVDDAFGEVEFGVITIGEVQAGAQEWDGRIEAFSTVVGDTVEVDYVGVLPASRYWRARAEYRYRAGVTVARDEFTGIAAATALNSLVAPLGGTWAVSGTGAGFAAADAPSSDETMARTAVSDTLGSVAILGSVDYTNVEVGVDCYHAGPPLGIAATTWRPGVVARYVDDANFLFAWCAADGPDASIGVLGVYARVGSLALYGVIANGPPIRVGTWYQLRLVAFASGAGFAALIARDTGQTLIELAFADARLASTGALATGRPGFLEKNGSGLAGTTRYFDNFYAALPPPEPIVINAGRSIEIRHDSCERESADGLTWGKPPRLTGGRALIPCAGDEDRAYRLWTKTRRNDIAVAADDQISDTTTLTATLRPRYRTPTA